MARLTNSVMDGASARSLQSVEAHSNDSKDKAPRQLFHIAASAGEGSFTAAPATSLGRASAFCTSARQAELQQLQAQQPDFPMDEKACFQAAADGNVELLQYLLSQQAPVPALRCVLRAATEGHGSALELLRVEFPHCFEPDQAMQLAAAVGDLRAVQALRTLDPPSPWDESICLTAARRGHVHVLAWIRQQTPPCPWDESVAAAAAAEAQLPVLQWLRSQPKPCPWDASVCSAAATEGHLGTLQWLRAQPEPCPWDEATCQEAAISGCLPLLQWLRNQPEPCPWDKSACCAAAAEGNLHVLQWIRDPSQHAPCPWDGAVTSLAAGRGHLHILQWIQTHGSSDLFNYRTAIAAFDGKQHHVLTWLLRERVLSAASMQPLRAIASSRRGLMLALHAHGLLDGLIWDHMVVALMLGDLQIVQLMLQQICQQNLQFPAMREVISGGSLFPTFDFPAAQVHYWQGQSPNPQHLEVAQMLLERSPCFDSSEQHRLAQLAAEQESIIPVQLAARGVQPIIRWNAVTHQLAAAHGSPALLRWLLAQQPDMGRFLLHGAARDSRMLQVLWTCNTGRMLLLVHGYGWSVPVELQARLAAAERRHHAYHSVVRQHRLSCHQQQQCGTRLGDLPDVLIKEIACAAEIDFSWACSA